MKSLLYLLAFCFLFSCQKTATNQKNSKTDFFKHSIVPSQYYNISAKKDTVIEGQDGTVLVLPKGSFINDKGDIIKSNITIELAEALTLEKMILSNLTTTSYGSLLETDGMIYLNATSEGEQLLINPKKPIYVEIPTDSIKPDMMVYQGIRDSVGNMNWVDPKPLPNFLVPLDIFSLDFLPNGFREEVEKGLPFGTFEEPTSEIVDSLYYFQDAYLQNLASRLDNFPSLTNESSNDYFLNANQINSFSPQEEKTEELDSLLSSLPKIKYGIDPLKIKAIRSEEFQNTLIATREFQKRLQVMFKICRSDILDIYINNLDKNMWELDSLVAEVLVDNKYQENFLSFQKERKTKVEGASINSQLLRKHYAKKMENAKRDRQLLFKRLTKIRKEEERKMNQLKKEYQVLLQKRKGDRMQSYGFEQTQLGWINIDRGTAEKDWEYQNLELFVKEGAQYDKVFAYVFYKSLKSLYRLNTADNIIFYVGDSQSSSIPIPKYKPAVAVVVAYSEGKSFFTSIEFETTTQKNLNTELQEITAKELNRRLSKFEANGRENSVVVDLNYVKQLVPSKKEKQNLFDSYDFLRILRQKSSPSDSSFMRFNVKYQIDFQVDTCVANIKVQDDIIEVEEIVPMN